MGLQGAARLPRPACAAQATNKIRAGHATGGRGARWRAHVRSDLRSARPTSTVRKISSMHTLIRNLLAALALSLAFTGAAATAHAAPSDDDVIEGPVAPSTNGVLNLNTASEEELMRLPGVGPAKAKAILELRTQLKGFKKVEDLMRV